jgi:hypothetical protein
MIESSRARLRGRGTKVFVAIALVVVSSCHDGGNTDGVRPTTSPPPVRDVSIQVTSCRLLSSDGTLLLDLSLAGTGMLRGSSLDATTDTPVMSVEGIFRDGDRVTRWGLESSTTRNDNILRLSLATSEVPSMLSISNLTFTVLTPTEVRAASLGGLENKGLTVGTVDVNVNGVDLLEGAVGMEFELSPLIYSSRMLVSGVQGVTIGVKGNVMKDQGLSGYAPRGDVLVQRIVLPVLEGSVPPTDAGPAILSIDGLVLQVTGSIETAIPSGACVT